MTETEGGKGRGWDRLTGTEGRRGDRQRVTETEGERGRGGARERRQLLCLWLLTLVSLFPGRGRQTAVLPLLPEGTQVRSGEGRVQHGSSDSVAAL